MKSVNIGDKVRYSAAWLWSISCLTGDLPFARGVVTGTLCLGSTTLAEIDWDTPDVPRRVNVANLERSR